MMLGPPSRLRNLLSNLYQEKKQQRKPLMGNIQKLLKKRKQKKLCTIIL